MNITVPYHDCMRLGQGYNSFKQQVCVDSAVTITTDPEKAVKVRRSKKTHPSKKPDKVAGDKTPAEPDTDKDPKPDTDKDPKPDKDKDPKPNPDVKDPIELGEYEDEEEDEQPSQTVRVSTSFVSKLSDVVDSMNVSGAFAIKYGPVEGSLAGSYLDSNAINNSDINFLVKVSVVNHPPIIQEKWTFEAIEGICGTGDHGKTGARTVDEKKFLQVYGDCFISGFLNGGEFTALLSTKIHSKDKKKEIQGELKAQLTAAMASGKLEAKGGLGTTEKLSDNTTTINVSWSGGGDLLKPGENWDVATLVRVATEFPKRVAMYPERTMALLTKYTACKSFVQQLPGFDPVNYENLASYSTQLFTDFVDYKELIRRIHEIITHPEKYMTNPTNEGIDQLVTGPDAPGKKPDPSGKKPDGTVATRRKLPTAPFPVQKAALMTAKAYCQRQLALIIQEVDAVTADPPLGLQDREPYYDPVIIEALLPVPKPADQPSPDPAPPGPNPPDPSPPGPGPPDPSPPGPPPPDPSPPPA